MKVVVIARNLKYRVPGINKGLSFIAQPGQVLDLPEELAEKEIRTGNVRIPLKEEKEKPVREEKVKTSIIEEEEEKEEEEDGEESEDDEEEQPKRKQKRLRK